jgi:para-nitrobenzyl esterase
LQWIQTDIRAFGGDASNVTIWGQSAGAINAATLLSSPAAKGLFHKVILMSGAPGQWASPEEYKTTALVDMTAALIKAVPGLKLHESGEPLLEELTSRATPEAISRAGAIQHSVRRMAYRG